MWHSGIIYLLPFNYHGRFGRLSALWWLSRPGYDKRRHKESIFRLYKAIMSHLGLFLNLKTVWQKSILPSFHARSLRNARIRYRDITAFKYYSSVQWGPNALSFVTTASNKQWACYWLVGLNVEFVARISYRRQALLHRNTCQELLAPFWRLQHFQIGTLYAQAQIVTIFSENPGSACMVGVRKPICTERTGITSYLHLKYVQITATVTSIQRTWRKSMLLSSLCTYYLCKAYLRSGTAGG